MWNQVHADNGLRSGCQLRPLATIGLLPAKRSLQSRPVCSTLRAEAESWKDRSESLMGQVRELQRQQQVSGWRTRGGCCKPATYQGCVF